MKVLSRFYVKKQVVAHDKIRERRIQPRGNRAADGPHIEARIDHAPHNPADSYALAMPMLGNLELRFDSFLPKLSGFESIDALMSSATADDKQRADYLMLNRSCIIERKTLQVEPAQRAALATKRDRKSILKFTRVFEKILSKANKQIGDSREYFELPNAVGLLTILNQGAGSLNTDFFRARMYDLFRKRADGSVRFPNIDVVVWLSDIHAVRISEFRFSRIEAFHVPSSVRTQAAVTCAKTLKSEWKEFNNGSVVGWVELLPENISLYRHSDRAKLT
jgi:hypothetical protein